MKSEKSSQCGACYFPTQRCSKPTVPGPKTATVLARDRFCFGYSEACSFCFSPLVSQTGDDSLFRVKRQSTSEPFHPYLAKFRAARWGWELHMVWKGMNAGHVKEQREAFLKDDNRSEVTKHGHLPVAMFKLCHDTNITELLCCICLAVKHWLKTSYLDPPWRLCRSNCSFAGLSYKICLKPVRYQSWHTKLPQYWRWW